MPDLSLRVTYGGGEVSSTKSVDDGESGSQPPSSASQRSSVALAGVAVLGRVPLNNILPPANDVTSGRDGRALLSVPPLADAVARSLSADEFAAAPAANDFWRVEDVGQCQARQQHDGRAICPRPRRYAVAYNPRCIVHV